MENETVGTLSSAPSCTIATTILFGTIIFTYTAVYFSITNLREEESRRSILEARSKSMSKTLSFESLESVFVLLHNLSVFGMILLFAYICEHHPPFMHGMKSYNRDEFFFIVGLLFLASAFTITRNDRSVERKESVDNSISVDLNARKEENCKMVKSPKPCDDVLNRDQTEEWKGWMQFIFLLYHYYHAEEVYNSIRIMITCYVWMTGFGNFSFFYLKNDYSFVRVIQMLWRLNFLVIFLCLSQGTTYILYYICPLHTFFFLMVYAIMRFLKSLNYTKYGLRLKLMVAGFFIFLIWDIDTGLFEKCFSFLSETPQLGATQGSMWEWYFRSTLDHWSTFLGMIFAANFPITSLFYRKLEAKPKMIEIAAKSLVGGILLVVFMWWALFIFPQPKLEYNKTNAFFGFIPLITYIYFRNITPTLRMYSMDLLHQIGKTTLETYLMQHHIWLTSSAKSLLILIPGWPKLNFLIVSIIYVLVSRRLYRLTLFLRGMFLPNNDINFCLKSMVGITFAIFVSYFLAFSLSVLKTTHLLVVGIVCMIFGTFFYRLILYKTSHQIKVSSSISLVSPLIGSCAILLIGIFWSCCYQYGAAEIGLLSKECAVGIHKGSWVPIDPCAEDRRSQAFQKYGVGQLSCSSTHLKGWGWNAHPSNSHCRYSYRDTKTMQKTLANRQLIFIGDSMVRLMYYGTLRSLGVEKDYFNTTLPKHSDMHENLPNHITLIFKWAPLAAEQVKTLKQFTQRNDLIVMGGGSWDRLYYYDSNYKQLQDAYILLSEQIHIMVSKMKSPIVWMTPTVIHDEALLTDEKRQKMTEKHMGQIIQMQQQNNIFNSASFVLDGHSFTVERVEESYDGVHYPPAVYDAGTQILANALDWILEPASTPPQTPPKPGKMAHPLLGFIMLAISFVGLFLYDGFFGASYFASFVASNVMPFSLYEDAFLPLHQKLSFLPNLTSIREEHANSKHHVLDKA